MSDENRVHIEPAGLGAEERQTSAAERIAPIIQGWFVPPPVARWEAMPDHQRQDFIDCAREVVAALVGDVLTVSQQGPVVRLDYGSTDDARTAYYALGEAGSLRAEDAAEPGDVTASEGEVSEKLVERLNARAAEHRVSLQRTADAEEGDWCAGLPPEVARSMKDDAQLDEQAASTLQSQARRVEELALDVIALAEHCGELANLSDGPCPAEGLCGEYACEQVGCIKDKADRARSTLSEGPGSSRELAKEEGGS